MQGYYSKHVQGAFCKVFYSMCQYFDEGYFDYDKRVDNQARLAVKLAHTPAGSGWRNVLHYAQIIVADKFQRYDFGETENYKRYG